MARHNVDGEQYRNINLPSYSADPGVEPQLNAEMDKLGLDNEQKNFIWGVIMFGPRWIMSMLHGLVVHDSTDSEGGDFTIIKNDSVRRENQDMYM